MRKVWIQTYGCQMNEYDSVQMLNVLSTKGFEKAKSPEEANLFLINSCAVREKSETKAVSMLGRYQDLKDANPNRIFGFGGCVGQTEGAKLLKRFKFLDFAFGTNNYRDLPQMIEPFEDRLPPIDEEEILLPSSRPDSAAQAFLTIINGCDKFCSYCIVPFTRGREISRSPEDILREASMLTARGVKEIMLLGQNVNSYWGKDKNGKNWSLYQLMELFQKESEDGKLNGLKRLRYTTSHPRDFDEELASAFRDFPIACEYLHLPFQAGSDAVLRRMRRFYTIDSYLKKMEMVRKYSPNIALSSDAIVGFPGETRKDFEGTLRVIREVEYDNVYYFKYSPRPYTRSIKYKDDVSPAEKKEWIMELQALQKSISLKLYQKDLGKNVELMMEGPSKGNSKFWTGRTRKNRVVHIPTEEGFKNGDLVWAQINKATNSWMQGERLTQIDSGSDYASHGLHSHSRN